MITAKTEEGRVQQVLQLCNKFPRGLNACKLEDLLLFKKYADEKYKEGHPVIDDHAYDAWLMGPIQNKRQELLADALPKLNADMGRYCNELPLALLEELARLMNEHYVSGKPLVPNFTYDYVVDCLRRRTADQRH